MVKGFRVFFLETIMSNTQDLPMIHNKHPADSTKKERPRRVSLEYHIIFLKT
jgi:hypothetical protein